VLQLAIAGGSGRDRFVLTALQYKATQASLNFRTDTSGNYTTITGKPIEITDFEAGRIDSDLIDISDLMQNGATNYNGANPFKTGHLAIEQVGIDTHLKFDTNGGGENFVTLAVLRNLQSTELVASNFSPLFGTPNGDVMSGLSGGGRVEGIEGSDVMLGISLTRDQLNNLGELLPEITRSSQRTNAALDLDGGSGNDTLVSGSGNDTLTSGNGNDVVDAGAGDDLFLNSDEIGDDVYDGGNGSDTASFAGDSSKYALAWDGDEILVSSGTGGSRLKNIEILQFDNQSGDIRSFSQLNRNPFLSGTSTSLPSWTEDTAIIITQDQLLAGYSDLDGDSLSVTDIGATNATISIGSGGSVTVTPNANVNGPILLAYTVTDGRGSGTSASLVINILPVDDAATGTLTIAGMAAEGGSLIGSLNGANDVDGVITSTSFQWQELIGGSWAGIAEQSASALVIPTDQSFVGKTIRLVVTTIDSLGGVTVFSGAEQTIANVNDAPTGVVTIAGTAAEGEVLTASNNLADSDGIGIINYRWNANGLEISGANGNTYALSASDIGKTITVTATYTDAYGQAESVTSAATTAVAPAGDTNPPGLSSISVSGSAVRVTFTEALATSGLPLTSAIAVQTVSGTGTTSPRTVSTVTLDSTDASGRTLLLTLSGSAPASNVDLRVSYTDPTGNQLTSVLQDQAGNDVLSFTNAYATAFSSSSSVTSLAAQYQNLTLTGTSAINGTGNANNNTITGTSAANSLNGGLGVDTLIGGSGNDTYILDSTTDTISELVGGGTDTIQSSVTFSLATIAQVENLTLSGTTAINGTGNALANILTGNIAANSLAGGDGNDTLIGVGGNDSLTGGAGSDSFRFTTAPNASTNRDLITDFISGADKLSFSKAVYAGFSNSATAITSTQFRSGAGVTSANSTAQRFIYNTTTGSLYYDRDGSSTTYNPIEVALLGASTSLTFSDFVLTA
ncbi:cadherin-like domain-containing protein, partial [Vulcanococcus limneticus]|uniref:cadherin-like domain-containing protein n=1 Tax=Vulcanococcus limneticus TaxID=2170428 RepID=UPI00398BE378